MNNKLSNKEQLNIIPNHLQDFVDKYIKPYEKELAGFIGYRSNIQIEVHQDPKHPFFSFSPEDNIISLPHHWIEEFLKIQKTNAENHNPEYTLKQLKFGLYHEASHFRDLLMERERKGRSSMLSTLQRVSKSQIKIEEDGKKGYIPIGDIIHTLYNCIDDVVVNNEAIAYKKNNFDSDFLNTTYKTVNFKDMLTKQGGEYNEKGEFVGKGNGNLTINTDQAVDYSKKQAHTALSYFLLRKNMVTDQDIILPETTQKLLYKSDGKSKNTIKNSFDFLIKTMDEQAKKHQTSPRFIKIKNSYNSHLAKLKSIRNINLDPKDGSISGLLREGISKKIIGFHNKYSTGTLSLMDLVELFTYSSGSSQSHSLDILPSTRYKVIEEVFEPIYKALMFLTLLEEDIPEKEGNSKGKNKSDGKSKEKSNEKSDGESDEIEYDSSILHDFDPNGHHSPSLEEKIKIIEQESKIIEKKYIQKEAEQTKYNLLDNFKDLEVANPISIEMTKHIINKYKNYIADFVEFLSKELKKMDYQIDEILENAKKGRLNYDRLVKELSSDPIGTDLNKKSIYDIKILREIIKEDIKKIDFVLLIDISGSMESLKGKNGILNIIVTIFSTAMNHLEAEMKISLDDPSYTIPVNYILYGDNIEFDSLSEKHQKKFQNDTSPVQTVKINDRIVGSSGGTLDTVAWQKSSEHYEKFLTQNPEYVKEIEDQKRKSVVIQIADEDVTNNGVEALTNMLKKFGEKFEKNFFAPRRISIGRKEVKEYTEEEYKTAELKGGLSHRDIIEKTKDGKIRLREVNLNSISQIIPKLKELFNGFFEDLV